MSSIVVAENNSHVHITLNRPEALNALNHEMVLEITTLLEEYRSRDDIDTIVFQGAGEKAFCAGGDVKMVHATGSEWMQGDRSGPNPAWTYFRDEYRMNAMIYHYPKRIISLCQGYVMGGGYGIAGNGDDIIVCENTKFAMPETMLGLFPDVGIGWKLARAGALGMYIALTGNIFEADMMLASGMATHFMLCKDFDNFQPVKLKTNTDKIEIDNEEEIKSIFSSDSVEAIFKALEESNSNFAKQTLETLKSRSPLSLLITFKHIKRAENEDYDTSIKRDYQLACAMFTKNDIYEGIRAQLIDKDKDPRWNYDTIFNISEGDIDYYFKFVDHI